MEPLLVPDEDAEELDAFFGALGFAVCCGGAFPSEAGIEVATGTKFELAPEDDDFLETSRLDIFSRILYPLDGKPE